MRGWYKKLQLNLFSRPDGATRALLVIIAAVFVLQMVADMFLPAGFRLSRGAGGGLFSLLTADPATYIRLGSNFHTFVAAYHQYWRFVTSCFLHFGLMHIAFNCYAFWDLGRLAERLWGSKQVFAAFIITGICGSATSFIWNMALSAPKNSAGASGAICGVLGLFLGAYYRNRYHVGEFLGSQLIRWAVYIVVFGLVMGADNAAHIGGMVSGAALGYFFPPSRSTSTPGRDVKFWNAAAIAALALLAISFVFAAVFYFRGLEYFATLLMALP